MRILCGGLGKNTMQTRSASRSQLKKTLNDAQSSVDVLSALLRSGDISEDVFERLTKEKAEKLTQIEEEENRVIRGNSNINSNSSRSRSSRSSSNAAATGNNDSGPAERRRITITSSSERLPDVIIIDHDSFSSPSSSSSLSLSSSSSHSMPIPRPSSSGGGSRTTTSVIGSFMSSGSGSGSGSRESYARRLFDMVNASSSSPFRVTIADMDRGTMSGRGEEIVNQFFSSMPPARPSRGVEFDVNKAKKQKLKEEDEQDAHKPLKLDDCTCVVCMDKPPKLVCSGCGQLVYCVSCRNRAIDLDDHKCPLCRTEDHFVLVKAS